MKNDFSILERKIKYSQEEPVPKQRPKLVCVCVVMLRLPQGFKIWECPFLGAPGFTRSRNGLTVKVSDPSVRGHGSCPRAADLPVCKPPGEPYVPA